MSEISSTDLFRALTSLVVTVPSVWYLAQPQIERLSGKKGGHGGHGHEGEEHEEHDEGSEGGEGDGEDSGEKGGEEGGEEGPEGEDSEKEAKGEEASQEDKEGGDSSDSEGGQQDTPDTSDDEGSENIAHEKEGGQDTEGVQFKGATSGGTKDGEQGDTRKHIPDSKGFNKKRIESHYGGQKGQATTSEQSSDNEDLV